MRSGFLQFFGAIATHTDEDEIRAADRMAAERKQSCAVLRANMKRDEVYVRMALADGVKIQKQLTLSENRLREQLSSTERGLRNMKRSTGTSMVTWSLKSTSRFGMKL